jgi:hypothetical protein
MKKHIIMMFALLLASAISFSQTNNKPSIPAVLNGISYNGEGKLVLANGGQNYVEVEKKEPYRLSQMIGNPTGGETGIMLDVQMPGFNGTVAYGPYVETAEYPTVAFLPRDVKMTDGKALLEFKKVFAKANDFYRFQDKGKGIIGYRVMDASGRIIYEGRVAFQGKGPYEVLPTIIEGPMVNNLTQEGCVISYETQVPVKTSILVGNKTFADEAASTHHEIMVRGLEPATNYKYSVSYGDRTDNHSFKTGAKDGSRKAFTFAFASANRATTGGGERDFGGTNYQSTRAVMAAAVMNNAAFIQTTGDFTNGGNISEDGHLMEYANFKRALEPFWFKTPVYIGFGDHEPNKKLLTDAVAKKSQSIEVFPYETHSGEATFAKAFVNPSNGPESEDGASYDPNPSMLDFPTYKENVFYYTYDNVAMIVLNTEYWESKDPKITSGCPEGYIMDQQVKWLKETMQKMEQNPNIDHIFVNIHGAAFPNGDHLADAMWWNGDNASRAWVAGKPLPKGAIERRDEILDICVNNSKKFLSFLSGDEHNFSFLQITQDSKIYLEGYTGSKIKISRPFYNINNGGGGSAPYGLLPSPWSNDYKYFTEPPVLALISVNGKSVKLKAMSAETFGSICNDVQLR